MSPFGGEREILYNDAVSFLRFYSVDGPRMKRVGSVGGMILTGEKSNTQENPCPSATSSTKIPFRLAWDRNWAFGVQAGD